METINTFGVLPIVSAHPEFSYLGDSHWWVNVTVTVLWWDTYIDHIEGASKHAIVVARVTFDIEGDVIIVVWLNNIVVQMHPPIVIIVIRLSRISC